MVLQVHPMFGGGKRIVDGDVIGEVVAVAFERVNTNDLFVPSEAEVGDITVAYEMSNVPSVDLNEQDISWTTAVSGNSGIRRVRIFYKVLSSDDLTDPIPRKVLEGEEGNIPTNQYRGCIVFRAPGYIPAALDPVFDAGTVDSLFITVPSRDTTGWRIGCGSTIVAWDTATGFSREKAEFYDGGNIRNILTVSPILNFETDTCGFERESVSGVWLGGFNLELT